MKRLVTSLVSLALVVASLFAAPNAQTAQAEPTGQYYYSCLYPNGYVYWLKPGENTGKCKGAADILVYINGNHIHTIPLTTQGTPTKKISKSQLVKGGMCVLVFIGSVGLVLDPPTTVWGVAGALSTIGDGYMCLSH